MGLRHFGLMLLLLSAPRGLVAQAQPAPAAPDPTALVSAMQAQLGLSREQVARINRIGEAFRAQNAAEVAALQKELQQVRQKYGQPPYAPEVRTRIFQEMAQVSARHPALSRNSRKAQDDVLAVLTSEQRQRLQQLIGGRLGGMAPGGGRR